MALKIMTQYTVSDVFFTRGGGGGFTLVTW